MLKVFFYLLLVFIIVLCDLGYDYYHNKYQPEKRLDEACADIINKMHSNDKSESIEYCRKVLLNRCAFINNEESWGYDNVPDLQITDRMSSYHNEAFGTIESEAFNGNPSVQFLLGHMYIGRLVQKYKIAGNSYYERVYSVEPDTTKAVYWWNEAAKQGFTLAYNSMGIAYKLGWGVDKDMKKAIEYLKKGAESGDAKAQCNYGDLFRFGVRVKVGNESIFRNIKKIKIYKKKDRKNYRRTKNN